MYEYRARIMRVVDGDTVHADVDLGCDVHIGLTLRLAGINAPEMSTPEGKASRAWLVEMIDRQPGATVTVRTVKDKREKYGRYLANLFTVSGSPDGFPLSINAAMVDAGVAVPYDGHGKVV